MEVNASQRRASPWFSGWIRRAKSLNGWQVASALTAFISVIPLLFIVLHLAEPASETWHHLTQYLLLPYVTRTLLLMLGTGVVTLLLGVPAAWLTASCDFPGRKIAEMLLVLPLAIPGYIMAYAYAGLAGSRVMNLAGLSMVLSFALYPYIYLIARSAFLQQSASLREAARSMGLGQAATFWRITLPMARPAIIGGLALVMMEVINDYGAVKYYGVPTFTAGIFRAWFSMDDLNAAVRLAACLLLLVFILLGLERHQRGAARISEVRARTAARIHLSGLKAVAALVVCTLPLLAGFFIPAGKLLHWSFQADAPDYVRLSESLINTLGLATLASLLCVSAALLLVWTARISHEQRTHSFIRFATLGYAVPGAVIAVGIMSAFSGWGQFLTAWFVPLLMACLVRFLAVAYQPVESGMQRISRSLDDSARSLGVSNFSILFRINFPLIRNSVLAAFIMTFVDVTKELPLTLILRPFNFDTLATRTFDLAGDERMAQAALPALMIVCISLIPALWLNRVAQSNVH